MTLNKSERMDTRICCNKKKINNKNYIANIILHKCNSVNKIQN